MQLLRLRYYQLKRDLGFWVPVIAIAAFYLYYEVGSRSRQHSIGFSLAAIAALYTYQFNRRDLAFVKHYLERPVLQILINYTLLMLPLSAALTLSGNWDHALLLHALAAIVSLLRPKAGGLQLGFISRLVPAEQFEWISGLRKNFYVILPLLLTAIVLSPVKFFCLVALFLLNTIVLGFYGIYEPRHMLNPRNLEPTEFIDRKVNYSIKMLLLTNGPLLLVNALFYPESAWFSVCFLFGFVLLTACAVNIKYTHYRPNELQGFHADFLILYGSILLPYLLPLAIYLYYSNRKKAVANLLTHQHDPH
jgi:hypothetical protein